MHTKKGANMKKEKFKGFILGIITSVIIGSTFLTVGAESLVKNIPVSIGEIKIYMDGNIQKPVDANGNTVEPMIYNGSTYLPVRALTGMLTDKEVNWDQKSMSVYIGKKPVADSTPLNELKSYDSGGGVEMKTGKDAIFKNLDETITPFNSIRGEEFGLYQHPHYIIYKLDSNYSCINGKYIIPRISLGYEASLKMEFYTVDKDNNETLLKSYEANAGEEPLDIEVNVVGVDYLKIKFNTKAYSDIYGYFYNITLAGL